MEHLTFQQRLDEGIGWLDEASVLTDVVETAGLLGAEPTAILGVCIGGSLALRAATTGRFERIVSLYGMVHLPPQWAASKG
jgi:carboxymethylenebutenolidase